MSDDEIEQLSGRLVTDDDLVDRFRQDPVGVMKEEGIDLNEEQEARLKREEWHKKSKHEVLVCVEDPGLGFWL